MRRIALAVFLLPCALARAETDRIVISGKVNGQTVRLALDTGAEFHVLFRRAADRLGLKVTEPPADAKVKPGQVKMGWTEPCRLEVGASAAEGAFRVVRVPPYMRLEIDGVLSWSGMRRGIIEIRWDDCLARPVHSVPADAREWLKAPIRAKDAVLGFTLAGPGGARHIVYIDTGAPGGVELSAARWEQWLRDHPDQPATLAALYIPAEGVVVREVRWAAKLDLGHLVLRNVPIQRVSAGLEQGMPGLDAVLGLLALTHLDVIIDGHNGQVHLRPRPNARTPCPHNRLGAVFTPRDAKSNDLVARVVDGGPAHQAGIRDGDVLLRIDDLDATAWRTDPKVLPLSRFWSRPAGTRMRLRLARGGEPYEAPVELRNILGAETQATPPPHPGDRR